MNNKIFVKCLSFIVILAILTLALCSCGNNEKIVGLWKIDHGQDINQDGSIVEEFDYNSIVEHGFENAIHVEFFEDGTVEFFIEEDDNIKSGTYKKVSTNRYICTQIDREGNPYDLEFYLEGEYLVIDDTKEDGSISRLYLYMENKTH